VTAEGIEGGFSAVYGVLKALEDSGRVRRGYFISGCGATQFALPGAIDRLRSVRAPAEDMRTSVLAATDPANPYGAALPWPAASEGREGERRPMRAAGALVVLVDGALAAWLGPGERRLLTFLDGVAERASDDVARAVARALAREGQRGRWRLLALEDVDGAPVAESPLAPALREAGFTPAPHGYLLRP